MGSEIKEWPSWRYGPDGQAAIFEHEEQVPEGWVDHPSKLESDGGARRAESSKRASKAASQGTAATDPTLGGDENLNRGQPETKEEGGATQGGETGQPADSSLFSLPPVDEVDKTWVSAQLSARKIPHNPRWKLQKLYDLLYDAVSPAK